MFIQTEDTPNPDTMKFLPSRSVVENPVEIADASQARISPLAQALFKIEGVKAVFLGRDFISVTKAPEEEWQILRPGIMIAIMDHFALDKPVMAEEAEAAPAEAFQPAEGDEDVVRQICELLDKRIRPAVAQDGGDVAFEKYEEGIVYLRLKGACAGCPSATATLKFGIEQMLRHFIPEVQEVRRVG